MVKFLLILLLVSQNLDGDFIKKAEITNGQFFTTDNLGYVYTINGASVKKYSSEGKLEYSYSNSKYGDIFSVDATNPMRILVFYKEFNVLIFLDNTLSEIRSPINLDDLNIEMSDVVCDSYEGGFWVHNSFTKQLTYFDKNLQQLYQSNETSSFSKENSFPVYLIEKNNKVFMNMSNEEVFVFDKFAGFEKILYVDIEDEFQVIEGNLYYFLEEEFYMYNPNTLQKTKVPIPNKSGIQSVRVEPKNYFIANENVVFVYSNEN